MFQFGTKSGRCISAHKNIGWKWKKYFFSNPSSILCWKIKDEGQVKWLKCVLSQCGTFKEYFLSQNLHVFYFRTIVFIWSHVQWWIEKLFFYTVDMCLLPKGNTFFVRSLKYFWKIFSFDSWLFWWQWRKSVGFEFLRLINVAWKTKIANANIFIVTLDLFLVHLRKIFLEWWQHKRHKLIWFYRFHFFSFIAKSIY